ncbi:MAG: TIM barrel protein [Bacteroidales bacterium]|nr:TIM barrel protein [Bacteroidales bacterium]
MAILSSALFGCGGGKVQSSPDVLREGYSSVVKDISPLEVFVGSGTPGETGSSESTLWNGTDGEKKYVRVYTKSKEVVLKINDEEVARHKMEDSDNLMALFTDIAYKQGKMVVLTLDGGKETEAKVLRSPLSPTNVRLMRERDFEDGVNVLYSIDICDEYGTAVPGKEAFKVSVSGGSYKFSGLTATGKRLLLVKPESDRTEITVSCGNLIPGKAAIDGNGNDILKKKIGIGLCSVQNINTDFRDSMIRLQRAGVSYVELYNFSGEGLFGPSAEEIGRVTDSLGIRVISNLTMASSVETEPGKIDDYVSRWEETMKAQRPLGTKYIVITANMFWGDRENALKCCETLNRIGEIAKIYGMKFLYHLHNIEFNTVIGTDERIVDFMLENTDPDLVNLEADLFWVKMGGDDPVEFLRKYADRIYMTHVKDYYYFDNGDLLDYKAIFDALAGYNHIDYVFEMEEYLTRDQMNSKAERQFQMGHNTRKINFDPPRNPRNTPGQPTPAMNMNSPAVQEALRLSSLRDVTDNLRALESMPFVPYLDI